MKNILTLALLCSTILFSCSEKSKKEENISQEKSKQTLDDSVISQNVNSAIVQSNDSSNLSLSLENKTIQKNQNNEKKESLTTNIEAGSWYCLDYGKMYSENKRRYNKTWSLVNWGKYKVKKYFFVKSIKSRNKDFTSCLIQEYFNYWESKGTYQYVNFGKDASDFFDSDCNDLIYSKDLQSGFVYKCDVGSIHPKNYLKELSNASQLREENAVGDILPRKIECFVRRSDGFTNYFSKLKNELSIDGNYYTFQENGEITMDPKINW